MPQIPLFLSSDSEAVQNGYVFVKEGDQIQTARLKDADAVVANDILKKLRKMVTRVDAPPKEYSWQKNDGLVLRWIAAGECALMRGAEEVRATNAA